MKIDELGPLLAKARAAAAEYRERAEKELEELLGRPVTIENGEVHVSKAEWAELLKLVAENPKPAEPDLVSVKVVVDD